MFANKNWSKINELGIGIAIYFLCVYNKHARSSADSFTVGTGALVNISHVLIALFWDPVANIIPREEILLGPDREIF
jgi:hypothetical protein